MTTSNQQKALTEQDLSEVLCEALCLYEEEYETPNLKGVESFENAGILTNDTGLCLYIGDETFQITIKKVEV